MKSLGRIAGRLGMGLVAGAAGTAALTIVQMIEMRVSGRDPSTAPADAVDELAGIAPDKEEKRERFSNAVHWAYGSGLGMVRGLLGSLPLPERVADLAFMATAWGAPMAFLPALDIAPPPNEWDPKQIAMDFGHHVVYAGTVALVWHLLDRESPIVEEKFSLGDWSIVRAA